MTPLLLAGILAAATGFYPPPPGGVTGNNATVVLLDHDGLLQAGDEICAYGDEHVCYGVGVWKSSGTNIHIALWGNNMVTDEVDGFLEGEHVRYRIYSYARDEEILVEPVIELGPAEYFQDAFTVISALEPALAIDLEKPRAYPEQFIVEAYPNPARDRVFLRFESPDDADVDVVVYDALGRRVAGLGARAAMGAAHAVIDVSALPPGIYAAVVRRRSHVETQRFIVAR